MGSREVESDNVNTQIIRDKGTVEELSMVYSVVDNLLTIEFDYAGEGYPIGKIQGTAGHWIFQFEVR